MKLSDLKGEAALDALDDMIEPASEIMTDTKFVQFIREGNKLKAVQYAIKNHKKAIIAIMAASEGASPDEYEINLVSLPKKLLEVFNDPEIVDLFQ